MVTITAALRQVKDDLPGLLEPHVNRALGEHADFAWRDRVLNPLGLIVLLVRQIMQGNTAIEQIKHLSPLVFTSSAYCQARKRLPLSLIERVSEAGGMPVDLPGCMPTLAWACVAGGIAPMDEPHRKRRRGYDLPGDVHLLSARAWATGWNKPLAIDRAGVPMLGGGVVDKGMKIEY